MGYQQFGAQLNKICNSVRYSLREAKNTGKGKYFLQLLTFNYRQGIVTPKGDWTESRESGLGENIFYIKVVCSSGKIKLIIKKHDHKINLCIFYKTASVFRQINTPMKMNKTSTETSIRSVFAIVCQT